MTVIVPSIMFLVGFAIGGGVIWLLTKKSISLAREQERNIALAEIRVAEERVIARDGIITGLRNEIADKDRRSDQIDGENSQLKKQNAVLDTNLTNEKQKTGEKLKLLDDVEDKFVAKLSDPVKETLNALNTKISIVDASATNLGVETSKLVKALQKPNVRGQWGEMHLRRVIEVTGMAERCDFHEQHVISDGEVQQRPDLVVHLPGDRHLAIDAKAPISAFLDAAQESSDDLRQLKLAQFTAHVRTHAKSLGNKAYFRNLDGSPEFVVLYLPTEAVYNAALSLDSDLLEFAAKQRVILAGPSTLLSLLLAVAHGWKQDAVAKNAREIHEHAEELYKRLKDFGGHLIEIGRHLRMSTEAYNSAIGSLELRVMSKARNIEKLGAAPADVRIAELVPVETPVRELRCPEFSLAEMDGGADSTESVARPR